jgi:hypothetical protein
VTARRRLASEGTLVLAIVAVAACLRVWALDQGLPFPNARPDEREALEHMAGFPAGDLKPAGRWFVYPHLFFYVVWAWEEALLALRRLVADTPPFTAMLHDGLPTLILHGRVLAALVGTATVALVWAVGRRVGGRGLGLLAAGLLATNFLHVRDSHALKTEVFLAAGVLASLDLLARWVEAPGRPAAIRAGVAIGVTTALKYPGIFLLAPAYLGGVLLRARAGWRRLVPHPQALLLVAVAVATFLAASPYLVLDFARTRETGRFFAAAFYATRSEVRQRAGGGLVDRARTFVTTRAFGYHVTRSLRRGCGLAFTLATAPALLLALWRPRRPFFVLAAAFLCVYYLVIGASPVSLARYVTPATPVLVLLVANLVLTLAARVRRPLPRAAAVAALALVLMAEPARSSIAFDRIAARDDTRVLATRWMTAHLPAGAVVARLGSVVFRIADPELPPGAAEASVPPGTRDLAAMGVTHVVTHEHALPFSRPRPGQMKALGPHLRLLAEFSPYGAGPAGGFEREDAFYIPFFDFDGVVRPGPLVRIYAYEPDHEPRS